MHDDDEDDDAPLSLDERLAEAREAAQKWRWQPGEREQIEAEMAARQRRIDADEILEWSRQRNAPRAAREQPEEREIPRDGAGRPLGDRRYKLDPNIPIEKQLGSPVTQRASAAAPATNWAAYIARQLAARDRSTAKAVAQVVIAEEKARQKADDALRQEMRTTIDELRERIDKLEAGAKSTPLKLAAG